MTEFRIDVVIDPGPSQRGRREVEQGLQSIAARAREVNAELERDVRFALDRNQAIRRAGQRLGSVANQARALRQQIQQTNEAQRRANFGTLRRGLDVVSRSARTATARVRQLRASLEESAATALRARRSFDAFRTAIAAVAGGTIIGGIVNLGVRSQQLERRILASTDGAMGFANALGEVRRISEETGSSIESNASTFQRLTLATRQLGLDATDTAEIVATLNRSFQIGGASAQEARAAITQLGQAIGSGRLQGDELRSVFENATFLADQLARQLGVSTEELRRLGSQGQLTSARLVQALQGASGEIEERFEALGPTLEQSLNRLGNQFVELGSAVRPFLDNVTSALEAITGIARTVSEINAAVTSGAGAQTFFGTLGSGALDVVRQVFPFVPDPAPARREIGQAAANQAAQQTPGEQLNANLRRIGGIVGAITANDPEGQQQQIRALQLLLRDFGASADDVSAVIEILNRRSGNAAQQQAVLAQTLGLTAANTRGIAEIGRAANEVQARNNAAIALKVELSQQELTFLEQIEAQTARTAEAERRREQAREGALATIDRSVAAFNREQQVTEEQAREIRIQNELRRIEIELKRENLALSEPTIQTLLAEADARLRAQAATEAQTAALREQNEVFDAIGASGAAVGNQLGQELTGAIGESAQALSAFALGGARDVESLRESIANTLRDTAQQILAATIRALILRAIIGGISGASGGAVSQTAGAQFFGGTLFGRRTGGTTTSRRTYRVGEDGTESYFSSTSALAPRATRIRMSRRTSSPQSVFAGRQTGGNVFSGGGAQFLGNGLFAPPQSGQVLPAQQTAQLMAELAGAGRGAQGGQQINVMPAPVVVENTIVDDPSRVRNAVRADAATRKEILSLVADEFRDVRRAR